MILKIKYQIKIENSKKQKVWLFREFYTSF